MVLRHIAGPLIYWYLLIFKKMSRACHFVVINISN